MRPSRLVGLVVFWGLLNFGCGPSSDDKHEPADNPNLRGEVTTYASVKSILDDKCVKCHKDTRKSDFRSYPFASEHYSDQKALIAEIIARVESTDAKKRMPPRGDALSAEDIAKLKDWLQDGAQ